LGCGLITVVQHGEEITEALKRLFAGRLVTVVAFGSRVRGDFGGESDLDILVVVRDLTFEDELSVVRVVSAEEEATGMKPP